MLNLTIFLLIGTIFSSSALCPAGWRQSEVITNKCYLIVTNKTNWFDAENYCKSATSNGHLTSISSAFEKANINAILTDPQIPSTCDNMWIGADDIQQIGVFTWMDGISLSYKPWGPGQPDLSTDKLCVAADSRSSGFWNTNDCGDELCFICENDYLNPFTTTSPQTAPYTETTTPYAPPSTTQGPNPGQSNQHIQCNVDPTAWPKLWLDVVLLIDTSTVQTRQNFDSMISQIQEIWQPGQGGPTVGQGPKQTRVAVVTFDTQANVVANLNQFNSNADLISNLQAIRQTSAQIVDGSNALQTAGNLLVAGAVGNRPNAPNVIIFYTADWYADAALQANCFCVGQGIPGKLGGPLNAKASRDHQVWLQFWLPQIDGIYYLRDKWGECVWEQTTAASNHDDAVSACHTNGYSLPSIFSYAKHNFLISVAQKNSLTSQWIGLQYDPSNRTWSWDNQRGNVAGTTQMNPGDFAYWNPSQPDVSNLQYCVREVPGISGASGYRWSTVPCTGFPLQFRSQYLCQQPACDALNFCSNY